MKTPILKMTNIIKEFPGVKALDGVNLELYEGKVMALMGENGAGKSTLIKCIMGVESPDEGSVSINCDGEWKSPKNPVESKELGMFANYQHVNIAKELSIAENYFLPFFSHLAFEPLPLVTFSLGLSYHKLTK